MITNEENNETMANESTDDAVVDNQNINTTDDENSNSSVRISFGRFSTEEEMEKAAELLTNSVRTYLSKKQQISSP